MTTPATDPTAGADALLAEDRARAAQAVPLKGLEPESTVFVGAMLLLSVGALLLYARYHAFNVPYYDEWYHVVPLVTGEQSFTATWLWEKHAEYRVPLQKFVLFFVYRLFPDFRAGVMFTIFLLTALSAALLLLARQLRGRTIYADAFLPLILLNPGQWDAFAIGWWSVNTLSALFAVIFLLLVVRCRAPLSRGAAIVAGSCLILMPLSGPSNMLMVPAFTLWLGYSAAAHWLSADPRRRGTALWIAGFVLFTALAGALYLFGLSKDYQEPRSDNVVSDTARIAARLLTISAGQAGGALHPYSAYAIIALVLATLTAAGVGWITQPADRFRIVGLVLFLGAMGTVTLGLGWGRSGHGPDVGHSPRYVMFMMPLLCGLYFVWEVSGIPGARAVQMGLFALMCALFPLNIQAALADGGQHRAHMEAFEQDLRAGMPPSVLAERHTYYLLPLEQFNPHLGNAFREHVANSIRDLHRASIGQFAQASLKELDDPSFREVPLGETHFTTHKVKEAGNTYQVSGPGAYLKWRLPEPRHIYAIRLHCAVEGEAGRSALGAYWSSEAASASKRNAAWAPLVIPGQQTITIWINDKIRELRIEPSSKQCVFTLLKVALVVPAEDSP